VTVRQNSLLVSYFRFLPGMVLCCLICLVAFALQHIGQRFFGSLFPEALVLSIVLGALCRSLADHGGLFDITVFEAGIDLTAHFLLECAVMLLGASIPLTILLHSGAGLMLAVVVIVFLSILTSYFVARVLCLGHRLSLLLACGNAICGNSAIVAVAPVIGATAKEITPAIAFTAVLGVVAVLLMPLAIPLFDLSDEKYGIFAGMVVYAVPQVLAATAPVSAVAVQSATLVKLMRVLMLGPLMMILSLWKNWLEQFLFRLAQRNALVLCFCRNFYPKTASHFSEIALDAEPSEAKTALGKDENRVINKIHLLKLVPWFIIGFGLLMGLRSMDLIPLNVLPWLAATATILTNLSMAALGLSCNIAALAHSGGRVILAAILSLFALASMAVLFCCFFI